MQFEVITSNLAILEEKFSKLNKKAEKYGTEPLQVKVLNTFEKNGYQRSTIEVIGCSPVIGKNKLIGVISKLEDGTNIVKCVPGNELPVEFRTSEFTRCDHCNVNRYRKEVVVVQNEDGTYIQLGKTCLKDYLGISLENLVDRFTYVYEECINAGDEDNSYGPREEMVVDPLYFLIHVAICVRKLGYVSSTASYNDPDLVATKSIAWDIATRPYDRAVRSTIKHRELYKEDEDVTLAKLAFDYASNLPGDSDFEYNIKNILRQDRISFKNVGYVACLITMYQKNQQLIRNKVASNSVFIGTPKKRTEAEVTCIFMKEIQSFYGNKILYKFLTKEGSLLSWFCTSGAEFKINQDYNIKFTVVDHQEFRGEKQTLINRVKA